MPGKQFHHVTYIRTTPEKLWEALIKPEFTRDYWFETWQESEWKPGASWCIMTPDGRVANSGEVLEYDPYRRLVLTWQKRLIAEMEAEGASRLTYELEPQGNVVKLTVTNNAVAAVEDALSLTGNHGLSRTNPLERHYRDVLCGRVHTPQDDATRIGLGRAALGL